MYVWSFISWQGQPRCEGHSSIPSLSIKSNGQSQTSSLGRPRSSANRSCTLLLYYEPFAYRIGLPIGERTLGIGLAEDWIKWNKKQQLQRVLSKDSGDSSFRISERIKIILMSIN
ncbi:hypothetical protein AVEN_129906-1 [Araneus ventricosus]|uniref:Uncharacterized protein n=1 Tax=Araneus ventricosus TaxID=182803 RepID=A0A4Y2N1C5_ARAVE|nr:hypothetical protein AVEN_129906-1 [Araneus ventricosus]